MTTDQNTTPKPFETCVHLPRGARIVFRVELAHEPHGVIGLQLPGQEPHSIALHVQAMRHAHLALGLLIDEVELAQSAAPAPAPPAFAVGRVGEPMGSTGGAQ
jgi:hypothetical protein